MALERELRGDGTPVELEGVTVSSTGLWGSVTQWTRDEATRGGSGATAAASEDAEAVLREAGFEEQHVVETSGNVEASTAAGATTRGPGDPALVVEVPAAASGWGQVVLLQDEDGAVTWHLADDVVDGQGPGTTTRGGTRTFSLPVWQPAIEPTGTDRGFLGAIGRKIVKVLAFKVLEEGGNLIADRIVRRWEERKRPHRLRRFTPADYRIEDPTPLGPGDFDRLTDGPALLLVHGTSSRSHSGFKRLPEATITELHNRYDGRVLAFDHPTVAVHPDDNVRWLANELTTSLADRTLDLAVLTHSRGGLVARLIAEQGERLGLRPGQIRVRELVMVGTPSDGTPYADTAHFKRYVDILTNLMSFVPDNPVTDVLEVLAEIVKHLAVGVHQGLDGLGSMRTGGDFLQQLNTGGAAGVRYRAIASDFEPPEGSALARVVRDLAVDNLVFSGEANDLIVPARGVYEGKGIPTSTEPLQFTTKDGVDHSSYWADRRVNDALLSWLHP